MNFKHKISRSDLQELWIKRGLEEIVVKLREGNGLDMAWRGKEQNKEMHWTGILQGVEAEKHQADLETEFWQQKVSVGSNLWKPCILLECDRNDNMTAHISNNISVSQLNISSHIIC